MRWSRDAAIPVELRISVIHQRRFAQRRDFCCDLHYDPPVGSCACWGSLWLVGWLSEPLVRLIGWGL